LPLFCMFWRPPSSALFPYTTLFRSEVLHSIASLHAALGSLDRARFREFVQAALKRQPELLVLSWNPVVPGSLRREVEAAAVADGDRKSTRLNSSHVKISYAVFCLKK